MKHYFYAIALLLVACGSDDSAEDFSNVQLETRKAYTGDVFMITGANFSAIEDLEVRIDNVILPVLEASENTVQVLISSGATSGILEISANGTTQSLRNFVVVEERDTMYAFVPGAVCTDSKIVKLASDTALETDVVYNFPETDCTGITIHFFEQTLNTLAYSYTYFVTTVGEAETAVFHSLGNNNNREFLLRDGPDDPRPITLAHLNRDILYFYQYRKSDYFRLYKVSINGGYKDEIGGAFFTDNTPNIFAQLHYNNFYDSNNLVGYFTNPDTHESMFFRQQLYRNQEIQGVNGFLVDDQKGYVLRDNLDGTFTILLIKPFQNTIVSEVNTFSATSAADLSMSKSTSRLFLRITEGVTNEQYIYKIPLLEGAPTKTKIDSAIEKIFLDR